MKKLSPSRLSCLLPVFALMFLLSGQALAVCLPHMMTEMPEGQALACCTQDCRMEDATPKEAQQACNQSRVATTSHHQTAVGASLPLVKFFGKDLPEIGPCPIPDTVATPQPALSAEKPSSHAPPYRTVKLYLLVQSLLL